MDGGFTMSLRDKILEYGNLLIVKVEFVLATVTSSPKCDWGCIFSMGGIF